MTFLYFQINKALISSTIPIHIKIKKGPSSQSKTILLIPGVVFKKVLDALTVMHVPVNDEHPGRERNAHRTNEEDVLS